MRNAFRLPRVKICGLTRVADLAPVVAAGAEAIGVISHPASPRHLDLALARALITELPASIPAVAVFVDQSRAEVSEWARRAGVAAVQLCGAESAQEWRDFELPILRRLAVDADAQAELERWRGIALAFVLDHPSSAGGSGREVDLGRAAQLARCAPCLLAGGLAPENVAAAIARVRPHGVDASSRLEAAPGIKEPIRVQEFVQRALAALERGMP